MTSEPPPSPPPPSPSAAAESAPPPAVLRPRTAPALILVVTFYNIVVVAAGLLAGETWRWASTLASGPGTTPFDGAYAALYLILAAAILYSSWPPEDRFVASGSRLEPAEHPRLFAELATAARVVGVELPEEVYLVPELDLWVAWRGGRLGFGGRKVMAIGMPLLGAVTASQLRALLAQEFLTTGFVAGGSAPWAMRARDSVRWAMHDLSPLGHALKFGFVRLSRKLLLRLDPAPRRRVFEADARAARVVGARPLAHGIRAVHEAVAGYAKYMFRDVLPLVALQHRPPLAEGLRLYVQARAEENVTETAPGPSAGTPAAAPRPRDPTPQVGERIAALAGIAPGEAPADDPPALSLLEGASRLDGRLFFAMVARVTGVLESRALKPVTWEAAGGVYVRQWEAHGRAVGPALSGLRAAGLPEAVADPAPLLAALRRKVMSKDALYKTLGEQLALALHRAGWAPSVTPGREPAMRKDGREVAPLGVPARLASKELSPEAWRAQCAELGIGDVELGGREKNTDFTDFADSTD